MQEKRSRDYGAFRSWEKPAAKVVLNNPECSHCVVSTHWTNAILSFSDEQDPANAATHHSSTPCLFSGKVEHIHHTECFCSQRKLSAIFSHCFDLFVLSTVSELLGYSTTKTEPCFPGHIQSYTILAYCDLQLLRYPLFTVFYYSFTLPFTFISHLKKILFGFNIFHS